MCECIYISENLDIEIYAEDLIWWETFRVKKTTSGGREGKQRHKKADRRKKKLGDMETHTFLVGFFLTKFNYKSWENLDYLPKAAHQLRSPPY